MINKIYLEESIMQKGILATAGSKMLENFTAPFDAEVVTRLKNAGIQIAGRVNMPEFGIPDGNEYKIQTPLLCNDLFGRYRTYAVENGMCFIKPAYGTVSRYGLIPVASSMDQIGILCENPQDGFEILQIIAGGDEKDGAMLPAKKHTLEKYDKKIKLACHPNKFESEMFEIVNIDLPFFDVYEQIFNILSAAEISNNINRYDGIKFGYRTENYNNLNELYINTRSEAFGRQTKLAAIMGCMVLSHDYYNKYYDKAMKIRRLIFESLSFDGYDVIAFPMANANEHRLETHEQINAVATLCGFSSMVYMRSQFIAKDINVLFNLGGMLS